MFRLMIVDDEPIAVDSLYEILVERTPTDWEIYKSYSSIHALETVQRKKMDIILCDIQMPELNGFELAKKVLIRWPRSKIIFITGYNDFSYVQTAIRHGSIDYVLKTEGDEAIFQAIDKAKEGIMQEREDDQLAYKAKQKLHLALPSLRRDYLLGLLQGDTDSATERVVRFEGLEMELDPHQEVFPILGMVDHWGEGRSMTDKSLFLYCIQNIAEEHLSLPYRFVPVQLEHHRFLWLLQPAAALLNGSERDRDEWEDMYPFINGALEAIQETVKQLLKLPVSLALSRVPCSWDRLAHSYAGLRWLLVNRPSRYQEVIITGADPSIQNFEAGKPLITADEIRLKLKKLDLLVFHLESNQRSEFIVTLRDMLDLSLYSFEMSKFKYVVLEIFQGLSAFFLSSLNRFELTEKFNSLIGLGKLMQSESHAQWGDTVAFFEQTAHFLFDGMDSNRSLRTIELIHVIQRYILEHLHEELSLTRLAEIVHLNPSYLSRFYKQETGIGLLEYITESRIAKAKELLIHSQMKVHEICTSVGLISSTYFARIFKKSTNLTPQEYRDLNTFKK